jgi:hypothetical protein
MDSFYPINLYTTGMALFKLKIVGTLTGYRLNCPGFDHQRRQGISSSPKPPTPALRHTQPPVIWVLGATSGGTELKHVAECTLMTYMY